MHTGQIVKQCQSCLQFNQIIIIVVITISVSSAKYHTINFSYYTTGTDPDVRMEAPLGNLSLVGEKEVGPG